MKAEEPHGRSWSKADLASKDVQLNNMKRTTDARPGIMSNKFGVSECLFPKFSNPHTYPISIGIALMLGLRSALSKGAA